MRFLRTLWCVLFAGSCLADAQYHEFEGVAELYTIRNLRVLAQFLPEKPVIIEAGAYQGRDTLKLAQKLPFAQIYAFEPLVTAFSQLSEAVKPYSNVTLFNQALDKTSGSKKFYICHGMYGQYPVFEFHSSLLKPTITSAVYFMGPINWVSCVSLFDFCSDNQVEKIDMLWLSTEGNELQVLEGAGEFLEQVSLIYIRSQFSLDRKSMTPFADLKKIMENNGFILLSHFYLRDAQGDALFVNREKFNKLNEGL